MLLVVLWSAFDVFLEAIVGSYFFVAVIVQYMIIVCDGVVRGDSACVSSVAGEELADFGVDKSVACGAEAFVVVVLVVQSTTVGPVV